MDLDNPTPELEPSPEVDSSPPPVEMQPAVPPSTESAVAEASAPIGDSGCDEKEMSLLEHLEELRSRSLKCIAAWALMSTAVYYLVPDVLRCTKPMLGENAKLIFTSPTEAFFAYLKIAMIGGLFAALPIILYQIIAFILPGLKPNEKRWFVTLLPVSIVLFFLGASFAYVVVLPVTLKFFLSYGSDGTVDVMLKLDDFLGFLIGLLGMCGVVFQLPLVLFFLSLVGIVKSSFLAGQRRMAIFLAFVLSALATPTPDAFTCTIVALPVIILFEISIWLIWLKERWTR